MKYPLQIGSGYFLWMTMKKNGNKIRAMTRMALCVALLCAASYVVIPLPFSPAVLSLHTICVNVTGLILSPGQAVCTIGLYLLMGLMGLPVFSGGTGGPGKLLGPAGGFYFGFLPAVWAISMLKGNRPDSMRYFWVTVGIGIPLEHLCAIGVMMLHNGFGFVPAAMTVSVPFLPGDIVKCGVASLCAAGINRVLPKE